MHDHERLDRPQASLSNPVEGSDANPVHERPSRPAEAKRGGVGFDYRLLSRLRFHDKLSIASRSAPFFQEAAQNEALDSQNEALDALSGFARRCIDGSRRLLRQRKLAVSVSHR